MNLLSYSLFTHATTRPFEENAYVKGFYYNVLMAKLLYPGWVVMVHVDVHMLEKYERLLEHVSDNHGVKLSGEHKELTKCSRMLLRLKPAFYPSTEVLLARDADALVSYREAQAVNEFIKSGQPLHGIHDNPAHTVPLMGGMMGVQGEALREE